MALIKRFEDLLAWQEARKLSQQIYQMTQQGKFSKDFGLKNQIQRAAVSVMSNIAEGFDCDSPLEFARFLGISRRSVLEVQSLLYVAIDTTYISKEKFQICYDQAQKTKVLVGGLKTAQKKRHVKYQKVKRNT